jgi:biopolymer transport protein ExbD
MKFETEHKLLTSFNFSAVMNLIMLLLIFVLLIFGSIEWNGSRVKIENVRSFDFSVASMNSLFIDKSEHIYLGSDETDLPNLPLKLKGLSNYFRRGLYIRSDKSVKIDLIMRVIELAKKSGIKNIILQTDSELN